MKKIHAMTKVLLLVTVFTSLFLIAPVATHAQTTSCGGFNYNQWPYGTTLWYQTDTNELPYSVGSVMSQCTASCQSEEVALGESLTCGLSDFQTAIYNTSEDQYACNYGTGLSSGSFSVYSGGTQYNYYGEQCYYTPPAVHVNHLPNPPSIWGSTSIYTNQSTQYGISATDPDGDNVLYNMSVPGVGTVQTGYVPSGTAQYEYFSWPNPGSYMITAYSYDGSLWSYPSYYTVNVSSPPPPAGVADVLTNTNLPNISATVGVPVTISAPAINQGNGATGRGFLGEFWISTTPGGWYTDANANDAAQTNVSIQALAAYGGSASISVTKTFNTPGSYYYQFCPNYYNGWYTDITESNYSNNCDQAAGVVTVAPQQPDLVPGTSSNLTVNAGQNYLFTSMITNNGQIATSGGFWNVLRICDAGCSTYNDHSQEGWMNTLAAGASNGIGAYANAPSTPGTYYYQIDPNNNTAFQNIVAESNYANNTTGAWATLTVVAPPTPPTPTCTLTANPSTVSPNQSTTLTWASTNTTSTTGSGFTTGGAPNGSVSVTPGSLPMSYGLSCTGGGGTTNATPVTLGNSCAAGNLAMTMTVASTLVPSGSNVTFNWSASNVQGSSCSVSGSDGYSQVVATNACSVSPGSHTISITHQTTYTITCDGTSKAVTVNVPPAFQEF